MATEQKIQETRQESININTQYLKELDEYFALKSEYESKYKEKIQKIGRSQLSQTKKIREVEKLKKNMRCINCGNIGGTFFGITTQEDGTKEHIAMCLCHRVDKGQQCGLNIRLRRGKTVNAYQKEGEILKNIEKIKQSIISGKLALLFNLETEDVALKQFDDFKSDLEKMSDQLKIVEEKFASNNNIQILNEKTGEPETINKNVFMKSKMKKLNSLIYKVKEASKLSEIESVEIKKKSFLKDAFITLLDEIYPLQKEIRNLKYQENFSETNEDRKNKTMFNPVIYYIISNEVSINNEEIIADEPVIVSNEK